jgi:hypothetical protein
VQCPLCNGALSSGDLVMVCGACHKSLGEGLSVHATGEFRVPSPDMLDVGVADATPSHGERPRVIDTCAWCGKRESEVKKLLGRNQVALCNECVSLCVDILDAECGGDWR